MPRPRRDPDPVIAALDSEPAMLARSPLSRWMRENFAALSARVGDGHFDWTRLTELLAEAGVTDRSGKPPQPEAVRKAYLRTRSAAEAKRGRVRAASKPEPRPADQVPGVFPVPVPPPAVRPTRPTTTPAVPPPLGEQAAKPPMPVPQFRNRK